MERRIWDQFLTEADRAHVERVPTKRRGLGTSPALLLVDLYRKAFGSRPHFLLDALDTEPGTCGMAAWDALPSIEKLLSTARTHAVPVIHVTGTASLPRWSDAIREEGTQGLEPIGSEMRMREYEIIPELAPLEGELVVAKAGPSGFGGTPLPAVLNSMRIDSLVVAGESTSGCVRATVVDACRYHYRVAVVEDCVFDRHEAPHAISLFDMDRKYADVVNLEEAVDYLRWTDTQDKTSEPRRDATGRSQGR